MDLEVTRLRGGKQLPFESVRGGDLGCEEGDEIRVVVGRAVAPTAVLGGEPIVLSPQRNDDGDVSFVGSIAIHTWAGRANLVVRDGDVLEPAVSLDVSPHPEKLGRDAFWRMVGEITRLSKDLPFGQAPGGVGSSYASGSPFVVHPVVIEAELATIESGLWALRQEPMTWTVRRRAHRRVGTARPDVATTRWLASHPAAALALAADAETEVSGEPPFAGHPSIETSEDHPATRYIAALVARAERVVEWTRHVMLEAATRESDPGRRFRLRAGAEPCSKLLKVLGGARRRPPLSRVGRVDASEGALQAVMDHPVYSRLHRSLRRILDPGLSISPDGEVHAGLRETHALFELLVLFRTTSALQAALGRDWQFSIEPPRSDRFLEDAPSGLFARAWNSTGWTIELLNQKTFTSRPDGDIEFASLTGERRPDYVIVARYQDAVAGWLVLDAKYRVSRGAVHRGLADMHVYRDALLVGGMPPWGGFIIVPDVTLDTRDYRDDGYRSSRKMGIIGLDEIDGTAPAPVAEFLNSLDLI